MALAQFLCFDLVISSVTLLYNVAPFQTKAQSQKCLDKVFSLMRYSGSWSDVLRLDSQCSFLLKQKLTSMQIVAKE